MALLKLCSKCGKHIPYGNKYCEECEKNKTEFKSNNKYYDKTVRKNKDNILYDKFYHSKEWMRARMVAVVKDHGLCRDCMDKGILTAYHVVHHIVAIKDDYSKRIDIDNLTCLCEACHQLRHAKMDR